MLRTRSLVWIGHFPPNQKQEQGRGREFESPRVRHFQKLYIQPLGFTQKRLILDVIWGK